MDEELTTPCIRKIPGETGLAAGLHSFSGQLQGIMARPMVCFVNVQSAERILFSILNRLTWISPAHPLSLTQRRLHHR